MLLFQFSGKPALAAPVQCAFLSRQAITFHVILDTTPPSLPWTSTLPRFINVQRQYNVWSNRRVQGDSEMFNSAVHGNEASRPVQYYTLVYIAVDD